MVMSQDELSDDDFDEITNNMEVDEELEDHVIDEEELKKPFNEVGRTCQGQKLKPLVDAIEAFAKKENTTFLKLVCFMAEKHCYHLKGHRKLSKVNYS